MQFLLTKTQGMISNELYQKTNLALLCEDIINGMIAANEFKGAGSGDASLPVSDELLSRNTRRAPHSPAWPLLEIMIDIENRDWDFDVQAGAIRRIVMNIFGNAQKYTDSGYILVEIRVSRLFLGSPTTLLGSSHRYYPVMSLISYLEYVLTLH